MRFTIQPPGGRYSLLSCILIKFCVRTGTGWCIQLTKWNICSHGHKLYNRYFFTPFKATFNNLFHNQNNKAKLSSGQNCRWNWLCTKLSICWSWVHFPLETVLTLRVLPVCLDPVTNHYNIFLAIFYSAPAPKDWHERVDKFFTHVHWSEKEPECLKREGRRVLLERS